MRMRRKRRRRKGYAIKLTRRGMGACIIIGMILLSIIIVYSYKAANNNYISTDAAKITGFMINISPEIKGKIASIGAKQGDEVSKGDILFSLETDKLKSSLSKANIAREKAFSDLEKVIGKSWKALKSNSLSKNNKKANESSQKKRLSENNQSDLNSYKILQNKAKSAQLAYDAARSALNNALVQAPGNGIIILSKAHIGDTVDSENTVMTMIDYSRLSVIAYFSHNQIKYIKPGSSAEIKVDSLPNYRLYGIVKGIGYDEIPENSFPKVTVTDTKIPVRIELNNISGSILPGMDVEVKMRKR